jgi:hypothetical protein
VKPSTKSPSCFGGVGAILVRGALGLSNNTDRTIVRDQTRELSSRETRETKACIERREKMQRFTRYARHNVKCTVSVHDYDRFKC